MCDPYSIGAAVVAVAGAASSSDTSRKAGHAAEDTRREAAAQEAERVAGEAQAIQSANAKLAQDQRRRREQGSLLARGAGGTPQPTLGDAASTTEDPGAFSTTRTTAQRASLLSRGQGFRVTGGIGGSPVYGAARDTVPVRPTRERAY